MQSTIMDRFSEKQVQISQFRAEFSACYLDLWSKIIMEWTSAGAPDCAWLAYSANYLFRTNNVRWAIDPLTLNWRLKEAPKVDAASDLKDLSFVLLTHRHADHLDLDLLSALRHLPITWVVPDSIRTTVIAQAGLPREQIIAPRHLEPIELNGIRILPFKGLHWERTPDKRRRGVPAIGYLIELNGKRWLFPGDTRTYNAFQLPDFGHVDYIFAHLWLGRGCALMEKPPLIDAFCQFCFDLKPRRIILTHLNELGRNADDFWDASHAEKVCSRFHRMSSEVSVTPVETGGSVLL
ncbi:MAG TPA: MBL fold metallo-hydrolase [Anaerolineales bacterium]|nr:MBL fold metallo-hydrolase [Anaerolineales bacterium]HLO28846.1 MBL fold metallo-hydrolase [Anaerolineales bacterium]